VGTRYIAPAPGEGYYFDYQSPNADAMYRVPTINIPIQDVLVNFDTPPYFILRFDIPPPYSVRQPSTQPPSETAYYG
ncbi:MAG: hypothetical protein Q4B68_09160, partial [Bacteroidales bacterium]|nr:hypothetical protein [Bacteroidales bacterium]